MKYYRIIIIILLLFAININAQLDLKLSSNTSIYEYGDLIFLSCTISNNSDSIVNILVYNSGTCQAEFQFDDYQSWMWTICLPASEEIFIPAQNSRVYSWTIDPKRLGIPNNNNSHEISAYFRYSPSPYSTQNIIELRDTISVEAPEFIGGQLNVGFIEENDSLVSVLKDSLNVEVLNRSLSFQIYETWQFINKQIDSIKNKLENNTILSWVEYNRMIEYDSISTITSVNNQYKAEEKYYLSESYPNPFNLTAKINVQIPRTEYVNIALYNIMGEKVNIIYEGLIEKNVMKSFVIDGTGLSSGIYFYTISSKGNYISKKTILLK